MFCESYLGCSASPVHARIHYVLVQHSAGSGHTAVAADPGVLDTQLARDYFRTEASF